jgi:hypothetical protein
MGFRSVLVSFCGFILMLSQPAQASSPSGMPTCEVEGRSFQLVLPTGSRLAIGSREFLKLAAGNECMAPPSPYDCNISLTRTNLSERYGNHCQLIENSPSSFDYYSLTIGAEAEAFATGTCYKVECQYGGEGGGRRVVYDNASYCREKPSDDALEKLAVLKQLGFCK